MSIDLNCFTKFSLERTQQLIEKIKTNHPHLIPNVYLLSDAMVTDNDRIQIAKNFGFSGTRSHFFIDVLDKEREENPITEGARIVYDVFGTENAIVTFFYDSIVTYCP